MNFIHLLLISGLLVCFSFLMLAIKILLKKNGTFPITSVGHNPELKKRGLTCAKHEEIKKIRKCSSSCTCK